MPTTKDQREILAETCEAGVTVGTLNVTFNAEFSSEYGGQLAFQLVDTGDPARDKTKHELALLAADGTKIADLTVGLVVRVRAINDFDGDRAITSARSTFDPKPKSDRVKLNRETAAAFSRAWRQRMKDAQGKARFTHVAKLDAGVELVDPRAHTVTQQIKTQNDSTITIGLLINEGGRPFASGTVTMTATSSASGGYTEGPIIVDDDDD